MLEKEKLKVAIVVHGRFYAFDLARALIKQGHDVTLLTNYPKHIVEKFGIPRQYVKTFLFHGILSRIFHKISQVFSLDNFDSLLSPLFSRWAAKVIARENYHAIHCFSGIAEELFKSIPQNSPTLKLLVRASSHIQTQKQLLLEEQDRANQTLNSAIKINQPNDWIIQREKREYELADQVIVLSTFAYQSFVDQGFYPHKLRILPLGAELTQFRPKMTVIEERCQRILSGQPLTVLMTGTFSLRKGIIDFTKISNHLSKNFEFKFVGSVTNELNLSKDMEKLNIQFIPRQPQSKLHPCYDSADIFIFPTIEDGYPVVLSQAQAGGLPIIATPNCSAPDIVENNETGWVLPIRNPEAFIKKLQWCHEHRQELAVMVKKVYEKYQPRDWQAVATDFCAIVNENLAQSSK
jgi:glycosyltransferase involved in cell wall biosynthesis